ncbi:solute carrier family 25 member 32-like [Ornithodoros turicata]
MKENSSATQRWRTSFNRVLPQVRYEHLLAGVTGGVTSTLVLHPLDLLKIRLAVNDGQLKSRPQYRGIVNAVSTILKEEGIRGFYRGVAPNCWGAGTSWGLYFLFYNSIKSWMLEGCNDKQLGPGRHMMAAAESGLLTLVITNPITMVKTRLCLQYADHHMHVPDTRRYTGMLDAFHKVYKYEGVTGLYKGFLPGMFNVSHGALQFMIYEEMKKAYVNHFNIPVHTKLGTMEYLTFAALSKLLSASVTYPYQLARARMQDQHRDYKGLKEVVMRTWRYEGFRGFYKGVTAYFLHVTPNICIVFLMYEKLAPSPDRRF